MAMHTSAAPLIETLQEYAGRMLKDKANPAEQLLPLVRENTRVVEGERALDRMTAGMAGTTKPTVAEISASLLAAFAPEETARTASVQP